jgi:hypothetical protein
MLTLAVPLLGACVVPEPVGDGLSIGDGGETDTDPGAATESSGQTDPSSGGETDAPEPSSGSGSETGMIGGGELQCFGLPDEDSCLAEGCNYFETVLQISDTCACTPDVPACLFFAGGDIGGSAAPDYFWHEDTGTVAMFSTSWIELPVGWRSCTEAGAPAACGCYEPFMEPPCP